MAWTWGNVKKNPWLGLAGGFVGDDFFTSEQDREGKRLSADENAMWQKLLDEIGSMESSFDDPEKVQRYGDINNQMFAPARSNVATANARSRQSAANRMGSRNATPEVSFGNIDAAFAPAYGQVEVGAQEGLRSLLSGDNQFRMGKLGAKTSAMGGKGDALRKYLSSLDPDSTFDDIMGFAGTASKFLPFLAGSPTPAPAAASDIRLKENIEFVGVEKGFKLYDFNYKNNPSKRYRGVMAQEVQKVNPDAVSMKDGFLYVDYSKLGLSMYEVN